MQSFVADLDTKNDILDVMNGKWLKDVSTDEAMEYLLMYDFSDPTMIEALPET